MHNEERREKDGEVPHLLDRYDMALRCRMLLCQSSETNEASRRDEVQDEMCGESKEGSAHLERSGSAFAGSLGRRPFCQISDLTSLTIVCTVILGISHLTMGIRLLDRRGRTSTIRLRPILYYDREFRRGALPRKLIAE
jgi:hypothetical protein